MDVTETTITIANSERAELSPNAQNSINSP